MVDIYVFYKTIFVANFQVAISLKKIRSLDNHQHHAPILKGFVSGSLSMPDHWSFESCVLVPYKQCVFETHDTGFSFTNLRIKLDYPPVKYYFHF